MKLILMVLTVFLIGGCIPTISPDTPGDPKGANNYGYHPLDPLPIISNGVKEPLDLLPDETIRLAIGTVSGDGGISFGPAKLGAEGERYKVVLDYIKFTTDSLGTTLSPKDNKGERRATALTVNFLEANAIVPVFIGVGLRMTADIRIKKGSVDLGSLIALGIAAKAEQITGTLVIQTLGVSGREISGLIPMPSEISESTIQNAILALAYIKAKLYESNTRITPRVVGVYNTLGGGAGLVRKLVE